MRKRDFWTYALIFAVIYIYFSYWIYKRVDTQLSKSLQLDGPEHRCPKAYHPRHAHFSGNTVHVRKTPMKWPTCSVRQSAEQHGVDIQMEKEWESIKVSYPKFILTVSGWVPDLQVPSYSVKGGQERKLHVIFVPHSHQDPGWLMTMDDYYNTYTQTTFDNMVSKLTENKSWKFIWAEMIFLSRWWERTTQDNKDKFLKLIKEGRLEIVNGAWVMSDEANVHFEAMLDQLIEGQQWLHSNIGIEAKTGWSIDQFGYSPTMPYMMKNSGIENLVIQRVHYSVKKHLAAGTNLEFFWRQVWDSTGENDLFSHVMPFLSYSIVHSCGPQPHVCCKFDFFHKKCMYGQTKVKAEPVTDDNVDKLSWELWDQLQKKAHLYKSHVLLVPHGDDFRYNGGNEWDTQLSNLEKLFTYMNNKKEFGVQMEFGTLSDYFTTLEKDKSYFTSQSPFPSLSGDFFPYTDRSDQYWAGYYTSRPLYKHITRVLQAKIRLLDTCFTLCLARAIRLKNNKVFKYLQTRFPTLVDIRRVNGHFQHHDAITGTSTATVTKDYAKKLHLAMDRANALLGAVLTMLATDAAKRTDPVISHLKMAEEWLHIDEPLQMNVFQLDERRTVIITNPLLTRRRDIVKVSVLSPDVTVSDANDMSLTCQINPVLTADFRIDPSRYEVLFEVDIPPLTLKKYYLKPQVDGRKALARVSVFNANFNGLPFKVQRGEKPTIIELDNGYYRASISPCSGFLQHLHRKVDDLMHEVKVMMMTYDTGSMFKDKSGAYTFQPNGPATELSVDYPEMLLVDGPLMTAVYTSIPGLLHSTTLYKQQGSGVAGVHVENRVNLNSAQWDNKELVMRLDSSVYNKDHTVCVDMNGFQMHRKQYRSKLTMQGNFLPLTTMAYIEDNAGSRLSILSQETHGFANLLPGWLEVVLDRRLMQGDWRGLNEGVKNNAHTPSHFILMLERGVRKMDSGPSVPACFLSATSHRLSQSLLHPLVVSIVETGSGPPGTTYLPQLQLVNKGFPPPISLVNLRTVNVSDPSTVDCLMILHHAGLDCDFKETLEDESENSKEESTSFNIFEGVFIVRAEETTLNGLRTKTEVKDLQSSVPPMELKTYKLTFG